MRVVIEVKRGSSPEVRLILALYATKQSAPPISIQLYCNICMTGVK